MVVYLLSRCFFFFICILKLILSHDFIEDLIEILIITESKSITQFTQLIYQIQWYFFIHLFVCIFFINVYIFIEIFASKYLFALINSLIILFIFLCYELIHFLLIWQRICKSLIDITRIRLTLLFCQNIVVVNKNSIIIAIFIWIPIYLNWITSIKSKWWDNILFLRRLRYLKLITACIFHGFAFIMATLTLSLHDLLWISRWSNWNKILFHNFDQIEYEFKLEFK